MNYHYIGKILRALKLVYIIIVYIYIILFILYIMSKSSISDEDNRKVKSWQTREALNKSEKNSFKRRS